MLINYGVNLMKNCYELNSAKHQTTLFLFYIYLEYKLHLSVFAVTSPPTQVV